MCGRLFTPGIIFKAEDLILCDKCKHDYADTADLFCAKCNKFTGKVRCGKTDSGFEIKRGDILHVTGCPSCSPGEDSAVILELEEYNAKRNKSLNNF